MSDEVYLSERAAAAKVGVNRGTLRRARAAGKIRPQILDGVVVLYTLSALEDWNTQRTTGRLQKKGKR